MRCDIIANSTTIMIHRNIQQMVSYNIQQRVKTVPRFKLSIALRWECEMRNLTAKCITMQNTNNSN